MKPEPQLRGPFTICVALSCITTNAGKSSFTEPSPYVTHAPSDGRPARIAPVFIWQTPDERLMPSAQHERITAMSSTHSAVCGSQSETQMPLWPCCFHVRFDASSGDLNSPIDVSTLGKLSGIGWPASSFNFGFGSNVSRWLGP